MTTVGEITSRIEQFAPPHLAEDWDPIGLAIGTKKQTVKKMLVALDFDANTLKEAQEKEVDFIFTHHPAIFSSLKTLNEDDNRRKEYIDLIRSEISLYAAHTNIDAAENGMNDWLAEALGLQKPYDFIDFSYQSSYKLLVLYTPLKQAHETRQALHEIGLGQAGDYKNVSYTSEGTGRFTPEDSADPYIGETNENEQVTEERVEMLVPSHLIKRTIQTIYDVHPYEEPVFHLMDIGKKEEAYGIGRVGSLKEALSISDIIEQVKSTFAISNLRVANVDISKNVNKIAIVGGAGEKYYQQALAKGAELYITGDISYHGGQDMIRDGLPFIDPGHYIERIFVDKMTTLLNEWNDEEQWGIEIISSTQQKDVFQFK